MSSPPTGKDSANAEAATLAQKRLKRAARKLRLHRQLRDRTLRQFQRRLSVTWRPAFNLYDDLLSASLLAASNHSEQGWQRAEAETDFTFEALRRLHARGFIVASEIRPLLAAGFASGALARWRTLHEVTVVASFLSGQTANVSEAYMLHHQARAWFETEVYERHQPVIAPASPLDAHLIKDHRAMRDALRERYGATFTEEYGWANNVLGRTRLKLVDLEQAVGMDHWRPWVHLAHQSIHATYKAMRFDIGWTSTTPDEIIPVGPSNAGLADPFGCASLSLALLTRCFVCHPRARADDAGFLTLIDALQVRLGEVALAVHFSLAAADSQE